MNSDNLLPIFLQHSLFFSTVEERRKDKTASPVFYYYYYLILNFISTLKNTQLLTSCFSVTELSGQAQTQFSGLLREGNKMYTAGSYDLSNSKPTYYSLSYSKLPPSPPPIIPILLQQYLL